MNYLVHFQVLSSTLWPTLTFSTPRMVWDPCPRTLRCTWRRTQNTTLRTGEVPSGSTSTIWRYDPSTTTSQWRVRTRSWRRRCIRCCGRTWSTTCWGSTPGPDTSGSNTTIKRERVRGVNLLQVRNCCQIIFITNSRNYLFSGWSALTVLMMGETY